MTRGGIIFVGPELERWGARGEHQALLATSDAIIRNHGGTDCHQGRYQFVLLSALQAHSCSGFLDERKAHLWVQ